VIAGAAALIRYLFGGAACDWRLPVGRSKCAARRRAASCGPGHADGVHLVAGKLLDRDYSLNAIALSGFLLAVDPRRWRIQFPDDLRAVAAVAGIGMPAARWLLNDLHQKLHDFAMPSATGSSPGSGGLAGRRALL
jgi:hypothetical protein